MTATAVSASEATRIPIPPEGHTVFGGYLTRKGLSHSVVLRHSTSHPGYVYISVSNGSGSAYETKKPCRVDSIERWTDLLCQHEGIDLALVVWHKPYRAASAPTDQGNVYFIADEDGYIKIGYATNIASRLDALQTASRQELSILASTPGTLADERALHRQFADSHVRGEWFRPSDALLAHIREAAA